MESNGSPITNVTPPVVEQSVVTETPVVTDGTNTEVVSGDEYSLEGNTETTDEKTAEVAQEAPTALTEEQMSEMFTDESVKSMVKGLFGDNVTAEQAQKFIEVIEAYEKQQEVEENTSLEATRNELSEVNFGLSTKEEFTALQEWSKNLSEDVKKDFALMTAFTLPKEVITANVKLINTLRKMSAKQGVGSTRESGNNLPAQNFSKKATSDEVKQMYVEARLKGAESGEIDKLRKLAKYSGISEVWINTVLK